MKKIIFTNVVFCLSILGCRSAHSDSLTYGVNVEAQWPVQNGATIPNYRDNQQLMKNQLAALKLSGANTIRLFVASGDGYYGSGAYTVDGRPAFSSVDDYLNVVNQYLLDAKSAGIENVLIVLGGYSGACVSNYSSQASMQGAFIDSLMSIVVNSGGDKPSIKIDLGNEAAPSNYLGINDGCQYGYNNALDRMRHYITDLWSYYADRYDTTKASFSSIMDYSADLEISGNRLKNLILALQASGKAMPVWFAVHPYAQNSGTGEYNANIATQKLRGVYQIYSDFGFLSNGSNPKETIISESFYEDEVNAQGIADYLNGYDGYNGGRINLSTVISWPTGVDSGVAFSYYPQYKATTYRDVIELNESTPPDFSASPLTVDTGASGVGDTTVSWVTNGYYMHTAIFVSTDGASPTFIGDGGGSGSMVVPWIQRGHSYTFLMYPLVNGVATSPVLASITVVGT